MIKKLLKTIAEAFVMIYEIISDNEWLQYMIYIYIMTVLALSFVLLQAWLIVFVSKLS
jgi:hypothetical protein